jgi:hypothetical protein
MADQLQKQQNLDMESGGHHITRLLRSPDRLGVDQLGFAFLSNTYLDLPRSAATTGSLVKSAHGQRRPE